jgi:hypothetical protein
MPSGIPSYEVSAVVLAAFERAPGPLTLAALKKALIKPLQAQGILREAVSGLMAERRIHRWPRYATRALRWRPSTTARSTASSPQSSPLLAIHPG